MGSTAPAAPIPNQARSKNLRACLLCSIVQTPVDFRRNGCPNCEDITQVKEKKKLETLPPLPSFLPSFVRLTLTLFIYISDERLAGSHSGVYNDAFRRVHLGR
jgi:Spt4/RpoE2 zinc finger